MSRTMSKKAEVMAYLSLEMKVDDRSDKRQECLDSLHSSPVTHYWLGTECEDLRLLRNFSLRLPFVVDSLGLASE
jgi:hypothetical protein